MPFSLGEAHIEREQAGKTCKNGMDEDLLNYRSITGLTKHLVNCQFLKRSFVKGQLRRPTTTGDFEDIIYVGRRFLNRGSKLQHVT